MLGNGNGAAFFTGLTDVGNLKAVIDKLEVITDHLAKTNWATPNIGDVHGITADDSNDLNSNLHHFKATLHRLTATIGDRPVPASRGPADMMPWVLDLLSADWHEIATRVEDLIDSQRVVDYMNFFRAFDTGVESLGRDQDAVNALHDGLELVKQVVQK